MRYACVLFSCLLCASAHGAESPPAAQAGATVNVAVNITSNVHPFSPLIFGVAFGDATRNAQMGYTVDRWGGNSTSRYNWQGPAHNAGNDYFYLGYGSDQTDSADDFIGNALNSAYSAAARRSHHWLGGEIRFRKPDASRLRIFAGEIRPADIRRMPVLRSQPARLVPQRCRQRPMQLEQQ